MTTTILEVEQVSRLFGGVIAVNNVSFSVKEGEIVGLIGPNGAGKSTLFNLCSAIIPPTGGRIYVNGRRIDGLRPDQVAALGVARTFQNLQVFKNMTVLENVMMGRHVKTKAGFLASAFRLPGARKEERKIVEEAMAVLEFVGLADVAETGAGHLPLGKQRLVELARALAMEPRLLLLDEIAAGLNHQETGRMAELIEAVRMQGVTVLVVEHDMDLVMTISDRVIVLDQGEKIAEGTPAQVQNNPRVITAYLGDEADGEMVSYGNS